MPTSLSVGTRVSYQDDGRTFSGTVQSLDKPTVPSVRWDNGAVSSMPVSELAVETTVLPFVPPTPRPPPARLSPADVQSIAFYSRVLTAQLNSMGVVRVNGRCSIETEPTDRTEKIHVWLADSCLWTMEQIAAGEFVTALRGLLQVATYGGQVGFSVHSGDCYRFLKGILEGIVSGK